MIKEKLSEAMKNGVRGVAGRWGLDIKRSIDQSLDEQSLKIIKIVQPYSMTSPERLSALVDAINYVEKNSIVGDIVECGVWKGGSSMAAAKALIAKGNVERTLYLYDTYEGMSEPTEHDRAHDSKRSAADLLAAEAKGSGVWAYSPLDEVQENLKSTGYPIEKVVFIKGKVEDTIPGIIPQKIAVLRLDTDWYESTLHELQHLFPLLVPGGVLIIDDYGYWEGARRAVDQYFSDTKIPMLLSRIDATGRMGVKI